MPAGRGIALLDRLDACLDKTLEQLIDVLDQTIFLYRHRCLTGNGAQHFRVFLAKMFDLTAIGIYPIDELQHANHLVAMIAHGDRQVGTGAVAVAIVE